MADIQRYIPPNLRQPLREAGALGYSLLDNVVGLDDDFDSAGEQFGRAVRQDPVGMARAMGSGLLSGAQEAVMHPIDTARGVVQDVAGSFSRAARGADSYLPEGVDLKNATMDQMRAANDAYLADMVGVASVIPATRAAGGAARAAGRGAIPEVSQAASDAYMVGGRLSAPQGYVGPAGRPSQVGILGEYYEARPISAIEDAAAEYMRKRGMDASPIESYPAFSEERGRLIAAAYDQMKHDPSNPDVKRAYDAMIGETLDQYNALKGSGIDFKFIPEGMADPYAASPAMGYKDLVENGRLWVFPTDQGFGTLDADVADNPLLARVGRIGDLQDATANDAFRAVHDAFGHFGSGNPFFRRQGEERAFLEHQRMYSPDARGAMTSETRGQNSWLNSGPYATANRSALGADTVFADQKTGLLSPWTAEPSGMPDAIERAALEEYIRRMAWQ